MRPNGRVVAESEAVRLRWGPHASRLAQQIVLIDPLYVIDTLDLQPAGPLAAAFRELVQTFDAKPFALPCARCRRSTDHVLAYPGSVALIGACERCERLCGASPISSAVRISTYEEGLRHVARSFRRGHRVQMRRMVRSLLLAKGGPLQATEASTLAFFAPAPAVAGSATPQVRRVAASGFSRGPGGAQTGLGRAAPPSVAPPRLSQDAVAAKAAADLRRR